jgi:hypothetical protein
MQQKTFWDPHPERVQMVLDTIGANDTVLDIGGWWKPFTRANYVVDYAPYATRAGGGRIGALPEHFTEATWFQQDICTDPLPFGDKEIDVVYCGQTLEDVRDPLWVCQEMIRVAKRGYIEVPSIWIECQYGIDAGELSRRYPGYQKHRWLVQMTDNHLLFIPKQVWLGLCRFTSEELFERYRVDQRIWTDYLLWEDTFAYEEAIFAGHEEILPLLERYFAEFDYSRYKPEA